MQDALLKAEIIRLRRGGTPMKDLLGSGKLTNTWRFQKLKCEDAAFRAELAEVEAEFGRVDRAFVFDPAMEAQIIALVREGWHQKQKRRIVGVPGWGTINKHRKANPAFEQRIQAARAALKTPPKRQLAAKLCLSDDEKERILDRLRQGAKFNELGADLPHFRRILVHRRADPGFNRAVVELIAAAAEGGRGRRFERNASLAEAIVAALRQGRSFADLGPGLPSASFVQNWRREDAIFAETIQSCVNARARAATIAATPNSSGDLAFATSKSLAARERVAEGKRTFLAALSDDTRIEDAYRAVGSKPAVRNWLKSDKQFLADFLDRTADKRTEAGGVSRCAWTEQRRTDVLEAISKGATLAELGDGMPTQWMVETRRAHDPAFDRAIVKAFRQRQVWKAARRKPKLVRPASMPLTFQLTQTNELYAAANRAVSRSFPPHVRDDIISEIVLSVLAGETQPAEIALAAKAFANAYLRDQNGYALTSFDAVLGVSGSGSFHELVTVI